MWPRATGEVCAADGASAATGGEDALSLRGGTIATAGGAETESRVVAVTILGGATGGVTTTALSLWLGEKVRDAPVTPPVTHP